MAGQRRSCLGGPTGAVQGLASADIDSRPQESPSLSLTLPTPVVPDTAEMCGSAAAQRSPRCHRISPFRWFGGGRAGRTDAAIGSPGGLCQPTPAAASSTEHTLGPFVLPQMLRFFYKADVQQKAKILRKASRPLCVPAPLPLDAASYEWFGFFVQ